VGIRNGVRGGVGSPRFLKKDENRTGDRPSPIFYVIRLNKTQCGAYRAAQKITSRTARGTRKQTYQ
jgi:hypothetical protein